MSDQLVKGDVYKANKGNSYFVYKTCLISHLKYFQIVLFNLSSSNKIVARLGGNILIQTAKKYV